MQQLPREEKWGYVQEDRAFIDSIVNGSAPLVTAFDGLMSVRLVDAVYESVDSNAPVMIRGGAIRETGDAEIQIVRNRSSVPRTPLPTSHVPVLC